MNSFNSKSLAPCATVFWSFLISLVVKSCVTSSFFHFVTLFLLVWWRWFQSLLSVQRSAPSEFLDFGIIHGTFSFYCFDTISKPVIFVALNRFKDCSCAILDINLQSRRFGPAFLLRFFSFGEHITSGSVDSISRGSTRIAPNSRVRLKLFPPFLGRFIFFFVRFVFMNKHFYISRWTITKTPRVAPGIRNCHCICVVYKSGISLVVNSSARTVDLISTKVFRSHWYRPSEGNETMIKSSWTTIGWSLQPSVNSIFTARYSLLIVSEHTAWKSWNGFRQFRPVAFSASKTLRVLYIL